MAFWVEEVQKWMGGVDTVMMISTPRAAQSGPQRDTTITSKARVYLDLKTSSPHHPPIRTTLTVEKYSRLPRQRATRPREGFGNPTEPVSQASTEL